MDGKEANYDAVLFNATGLKADYHQLEIVNISKNDSSRPILDISHVSG